MTRKNTIALIACTTLAALLGACSSTQECGSACGTTCNNDGKVSIAQAEKMYGQPSGVRYGADGSETWTWDSHNKSIKFMNGVAVE